MEERIVCPKCSTPVAPPGFFCSNCGKKLKEPPVSTNIGRQIWIYFISFFFPPFGLWPGIRYIRQNNTRANIIGFVAILLTVVSIILTIVVYLQLVHRIQQQIQSQLSIQGY